MGLRRLGEREGVLDLDRARLDVDDHQLGRQAVHDEHHSVQPKGLAGVDFRVRDAGRFAAIIAPHHFFIRRDFGNVFHAAEEDVAVGKHPDVVVFVAGAGGISPDYLALVDEVHFIVVLTDVEHGVLRQTLGRAGSQA